MKKDKEEKCKCKNCECENCNCESCECENCTCENCECENGKECACSSCKEDEGKKKSKHNDKEIEELKKELSEANDKCIRIQAEMMNFKRRKEEETSLRLKYCNEDILKKFIEIVDNFERALSNEDISEEANKYLQGFKMMYTNMLEILRANEVTEIEVFGKPFDPTTSEALLVEHSDEYDSNVVIEVLQKGYMYKDKLLRSAMVKINDGE